MCGFASFEIERVYYIFPVSFFSLEIGSQLPHPIFIMSSIDEEIGSEILEPPWVVDCEES
jgi:hypothetical protein